MADNLHWTIGDVTITRVVESVAHIPAGGLLPSASDEVIASHASWLRRTSSTTTATSCCRSTRSASAPATARIIVDTCIGNDRQIPGMEALNLQTPFLDRSRRRRLRREEVDTVICTHLHFDHVGGTRCWSTASGCPRSRTRATCCAATSGSTGTAKARSGYAATIDDAVRPVIDAGLADLVAPDHRVTDEIRLELDARPHAGPRRRAHRVGRAARARSPATSRTTRCSSPNPTGSRIPTPTATSRRRPAGACSPSTVTPTCW